MNWINKIIAASNASLSLAKAKFLLWHTSVYANVVSHSGQ